MALVLDWPALNSLIWLRLPCCEREHPTRAEDLIGDDKLVIAWPSLPHDDPVDLRITKDGFFLGWVNGRGALEVPVDVVDSTNEPVPLWTVVAVGPGIETQRRSFVRLNLELDVNLYILEGGAPTTVHMLDISEGGMRCKANEWTMDPGGKVFSTQVTLDGRDYYLRSQIAWRGSSDAKGNHEIGIRFVDMEPAVSDSIRAYIFKAQLAERRRSLQ